eukprot:2067488-Rhodomonas_salina.2
MDGNAGMYGRNTDILGVDAMIPDIPGRSAETYAMAECVYGRVADRAGALWQAVQALLEVMPAFCLHPEIKYKKTQSHVGLWYEMSGTDVRCLPRAVVRCPVLTYAICLGMWHAMPGTDLRYSPRNGV